MEVLLAGTYPEGTLEKFQNTFAGTDIHVRAVVTEAEFKKESDVDAIILRILKMPKEVINRFSPRLKMIMRWGAGYDAVDIKAARERNIDVCNRPGAYAFAVSVLAVLLMLAVGRNLLAHEEKLREGVWSRELFNKTSQSLRGKIVGIVGGGNIGRQVARKVQVFGAKTFYYDAFRLSEEMEQQLELQYVEYEQLLKESDVITFHVPLMDSTAHMLNTENISLLKQNAIVINTARSGIIDDAALLEAVKNGHVLGAGLDCTEETPISKDNPLLQYPNFIVTPHVGGVTNDIAESIMPMIVENLRLIAKQESPKYVVNNR